MSKQIDYNVTVLNSEKRTEYKAKIAGPMKDGTIICIGDTRGMREVFLSRPIGANDLDADKDWVALTREEYETAMLNSTDPFGPAVSQTWWQKVLHTAKEMKIIDDVENITFKVNESKVLTRPEFQAHMKQASKYLRSLAPPVQRAKKYREPPKPPAVTTDIVLAYVLGQDGYKGAAIQEHKLQFLNTCDARKAWIKGLPKSPFTTYVHDIDLKKQVAIPWLRGVAPENVGRSVLKQLLNPSKIPPPPPKPDSGEAKIDKDVETNWSKTLKEEALLSFKQTVKEDDEIVAGLQTVLSKFYEELDKYTQAVETYKEEAASEANKRREAFEAKMARDQ